MTALVVGIDPGLGGATVALDTSSGEVVRVYDTPTSWRTLFDGRTRRKYDLPGMVEILEDIETHGTIELCIVEHQQPFFRDGKVSSGTTCHGLGLWEGMLAKSRIPYITVTPARWKNALQLEKPTQLPDGSAPTRSQASRLCKEQSRLLALRLYPNIAAQLRRKKHHDRAEALLLCHYACQFILPRNVA